MGFRRGLISLDAHRRKPRDLRPELQMIGRYVALVDEGVISASEAINSIRDVWTRSLGEFPPR